MDILLKETVNATVNSRYPGMAPEGRKLIEETLIRKELEKGELLLNEGQISHNLVFVGKGMLRQFYYKNGKDVTEHFSYENCIIICIESTLKQEPTHLMIEALENSVVYLLPFNKLLMLTEISWEINMFYRKIRKFFNYRQCFFGHRLQQFILQLPSDNFKLLPDVIIFDFINLLHRAFCIFVFVIGFCQRFNNFHGIIFAKCRPYIACDTEGFLLICCVIQIFND